MSSFSKDVLKNESLFVLIMIVLMSLASSVLIYWIFKNSNMASLKEGPALLGGPIAAFIVVVIMLAKVYLRFRTNPSINQEQLGKIKKELDDYKRGVEPIIDKHEKYQRLLQRVTGEWKLSVKFEDQQGNIVERIGTATIEPSHNTPDRLVIHGQYHNSVDNIEGVWMATDLLLDENKLYYFYQVPMGETADLTGVTRLNFADCTGDDIVPKMIGYWNMLGRSGLGKVTWTRI